MWKFYITWTQIVQSIMKSWLVLFLVVLLQLQDDAEAASVGWKIKNIYVQINIYFYLYRYFGSQYHEGIERFPFLHAAPDTMDTMTMEGAAHPIVKRDVWAKTRHFDASNPEDVDFTIHQVKINGVWWKKINIRILFDLMILVCCCSLHYKVLKTGKLMGKLTTKWF